MKRRKLLNRDRENRKVEILCRIESAKQMKLKVVEYHSSLERAYLIGEISYPEYQNKLSALLKNRSIEQWEKYYSDCIKSYKQEYGRVSKPVDKKENILPYIMFGMLLMVSLGVIILSSSGIMDSFMGVTGFAGIQESGNNPPTITSVILNATTSRNNTKDNLTVTIIASDPDGDGLKNIVSWQKNGQPYALIQVPFDGVNNSVTGNVMDYAGYGYNGTANGATWNNTAGHDGRGAYEFNGSNNWISFGNITEMSEAGNFSFSIWFKRYSDKNLQTTHGVNNVILSQTHTTTTDNLQIGTDGNNLEVYLRTQNANLMTPYDLGIQDNQWYHLIIDYNSRRNAELNIYLDGKLEVESTTYGGDLTLAPDAELSLGLARPEGDQTGDFNGSIDDFILFNHSLNREEINNIFNNRTNEIPFTATKKGDYWRAAVYSNDNRHDGNVTISNIINITNTAPNITQLSINSTNSINSTFANITVSAIASDLDSDTVTNIYQWQIDGEPFAVVNMPFEYVNDSSTEVAHDFSGLGNDVQVENLEWLPYGGYNGKGAISFDGLGSNFQIPDSGYINTNDMDSKTVEFRFKANDVSNRQVIYKEGSNGKGLNIYIDSGRLFYSIYNQGPTFDTHLNITISADKWYHAAIVLENGTTEISPNKVYAYLDGQKFAQGYGANVLSHSGDIFVGKGGDTSIKYYDGNSGLTNPFNGTIDEFRIYGVPLTRDQIWMHYNNRTDVIASSMTHVNQFWNVTIYPLDLSEVGQANRTYSHKIISDLPNVTSLIVNSSNSFNGTSNNITANVNVTAGSYIYKTIYDWTLNSTNIQSLIVPFERLNDTDTGNAHDFSSFGHHATVDDGVVWNATGGYDGNAAYEFYSGAGSIDFSSFLNLVNSSFSIGMWIKTNSSSDQMFAQRGSNKGYLFGLHNQLLTFAYRYQTDDSANVLNASFNPDNNWHHVFATLNESRVLKIYLDGILVGNSTVTSMIAANPTSDLQLGATDTTNLITRSSNDDWFLNGSLDDVMQYNISISPQQVYALYHNKTNTIVANETKKNQTWFVRAYSFDGYEVSNYSQSNVFTVLIDSPVDSSSPTIIGSSPSVNFSSGTVRANFSISTNETAVCKFANDGSSTFASMTKWMNSTNNLTHRANVTISDGVLYRYNITCDDLSQFTNLVSTSVNFSVDLASNTTPVSSPTPTPTSGGSSIDTPEGSAGQSTDPGVSPIPGFIAPAPALGLLPIQPDQFVNYQQYCHQDTECFDGEYCYQGYCYEDYECYQDSECAVGEYCFNGNCFDDVQCYVDSECGEGNYCFEGYCYVDNWCYADTECGSDNICYEGYCYESEEGCYDDYDCVDYTYCNEGYCDYFEEGWCYTDYDCPDSQYCYEGLCTYYEEELYECVEDYECGESWYCNEGSCNYQEEYVQSFYGEKFSQIKKRDQVNTVQKRFEEVKISKNYTNVKESPLETSTNWYIVIAVMLMIFVVIAQLIVIVVGTRKKKTILDVPKYNSIGNGYKNISGSKNVSNIKAEEGIKFYGKNMFSSKNKNFKNANKLSYIYNYFKNFALKGRRVGWRENNKIKSVVLQERLQMDNKWKPFHTEIKYLHNGQAEIMQNGKDVRYVQIPEYQGDYIWKYSEDKDRYSEKLLQAMFATSDSQNDILAILVFMTGVDRMKIRLLTPSMEDRKLNEKRVACMIIKNDELIISTSAIREKLA